MGIYRSASMGACLQHCFKSNLEGFGGQTAVKEPPSPVLGRKGDNVNVAKGTTISGAGLATCAVEMEQDKAYWEVKVTKNGPMWVGVATGASPMVAIPDVDEDQGTMGINKLWGYRTDDECLKGKVTEGTVLGMSYNQASGPPEVNFFVDGVLIEGAAIGGIRGVVSPAVGVAEGAAAKCNFSHKFECAPTGRYAKYDGIILAGSMI